MRTLAIDLGSKRIGLALSDAGGRIATPHDVLTVRDPIQAIDPIVQLIARESVARVVVGLPLNMDGSSGPQARKVIDWTKALFVKLKVEIKGTAPFVFVDERLSSFHAEQQLIARKRGGEKITRKSKKEMLDAIAAATFLQEFLDGKLPAIDIGKIDQS